jgi:hypothetical protein
MNRHPLPGAIFAALVFLLSGAPVMSQNATPDSAEIQNPKTEIQNSLDPNEKPGERPYEMVWANRQEPAPPTLRFDDLRGWTMQVEGGAQAILQVSRAQNVWNRPIAKLRYKGGGKPGSPVIRVLLPQPVALPDGADCVEMWAYGNRWDWVNPPDTPPVTLLLNLRDADGKPFQVQVDYVRWEEWWLMHRKLPAGIRFPATLASMEFRGGWQPEWREIFLDSIRFYKESLAPLRVAPRPKRNLTLFAGQSPGANTGEGKLPFPTREETILPMHMSGPYRNETTALKGGTYIFTYSGGEGTLRYSFDPAQGLSGIRAEFNGAPVGRLMDGAGVKTGEKTAGGKLKSAHVQRGVVSAEYDDGTILRLRVKQKSLIVDVINPTGQAADLSFGQASGVKDPRTLWMPYITYGGSHPSFLISKAGRAQVFTSLWPDWYRSNGSELYGAEQAGKDTARINGGVRYNLCTDGKRNPMFERLFLTVSPMLEEVMPVVPNPVGLHAKEAADRLWQESWGPDDFQKQAKRSEMLRAYGIEKLIQCNHEISWRDGGESFTLRVHAAPKKGGDEAQRRYIAHQRRLGWYSGLYTNYTDFSPVNEHWTPDAVQRDSSGEWRSAWPRCWAEKPLKAVEWDALLAPQIEAKYRTNSAYTDVHTAVAPWGYCDYDARLPGAGTFAQTFYAYGELLRNDSRVYGGPIFSEGTYQWLYAGLADGNYGHTYDGRTAGADMLLPIFDLYQIHTKECDIGVSWTSFFCDAIPNWRAPENIDRAMDRFLLTTLAYGHIGWLVEEEHGIGRTCRSYYMLQQVQARYGLKTPRRIAYWDGKTLRSVSEAVLMDLPRTRRQLYIEYPGGLQLWLNDHPSEEWRVRVGGQTLALPPAGWAATEEMGKRGNGVTKSQRPTPNAQRLALLSYSALHGAGKADYLRSDAYVYLDGRGQWFQTPEAGSNGALAITKTAKNRLRVIHISGDGDFMIRRPYGMAGTVTECRAYDVAGKDLGAAKTHDSGAETYVEPVKDAIRYELAFSGRRTWSVTPAFTEATPGAWVPLQVKGRQQDGWDVETTRIRQNQLFIPETAGIGDWVRATARSGEERREVRVRVCAPVQWRWQTVLHPEGAALKLLPQWKLDGWRDGAFTISVEPPEGWQTEPTRFGPFQPEKPPLSLGLLLRSSAPAGAMGTLRLVFDDEDHAYTRATELLLARVEQSPVIADVQSKVATWGIAFRGRPETTETANTGAVCYPSQSLAVGGAAKRGLFMHPPYQGGVGYTWAEMQAVPLPAAPCAFHAFIGLMDGGDPSDGVLYRVEVIDAKGVVHRVSELLGVQKEWRELRADLSAFAGQKVRLRLIADAGPADNSTADWACWGEPVLQLRAPHTVTEVTVIRSLK